MVLCLYILTDIVYTASSKYSFFVKARVENTELIERRVTHHLHWNKFHTAFIFLRLNHLLGIPTRLVVIKNHTLHGVMNAHPSIFQVPDCVLAYI